MKSRVRHCFDSSACSRKNRATIIRNRSRSAASAHAHRGRIARSNRFSSHTDRIAAVRFLILTVSPVAAEYAILFPAGCGGACLATAGAIGWELGGRSPSSTPPTVSSLALFRCICVWFEFSGLFDCMPLSMLEICDKMRAVRGQNGVCFCVGKGLNREKKDLSATFGLESP